MALVENFLKCELKVSKKELGATHLAKHTIDVGDHPPIKQKYHVRSPAMMDEMNKLMDKLIKQKLVEPSNSLILDKLQKVNYISTIDLDDVVFSNLLACLLELPTPLRRSNV